MKDKIYAGDVQRIMDDWAKTANVTDMFFNVVENIVYVFTASPGRVIGKGGECINEYKELLKQKGAKDIKLTEVHPAIIPEIKYGMDKCPLENVISSGKCYDYDRLGTVACGLCGANETLSADGRMTVMNGIKRMNDENKQ